MRRIHGIERDIVSENVESSLRAELPAARSRQFEYTPHLLSGYFIRRDPAFTLSGILLKP